MAYSFFGLLLAIGLAAPAYPQVSEQTQQCAITREAVDNYVWELYQRTPKIDSTGDFVSKDPKAAAFLNMTLKQYVIDGLDWEFELRVYFASLAMEYEGLTPGITSAFRDDYRQQLIVKGVRSNVGYSYHGGSKRGGYGHAIAVDMISIGGTTRNEQYEESKKLWRWIDRNSRMFGIWRPIGGRDPMHVMPLVLEHKYEPKVHVAHVRAHTKKIRVAALGKKHPHAAKQRQVVANSHKNHTTRG